MRVIAGKYRGKKLTPPKDENVRPTTDRIKETVFNILQFKVQGARVLDLFAGSGALGIECLSRGASEVIFADKASSSVELVKKNLEGIDGRYNVVIGDFLSVLHANAGKQFDLIFLDPPYNSMLGEIAIDVIAGLKLLSPNGTIYYEHGRNDDDYVPPRGYKTRTKPMGLTVAEFITVKTVVMFTGSFDPMTKGHEAVVDEALGKFDEVVVACLENPDKNYFFTPEQRLAIVGAAVKDKKGASAVGSPDSAVLVAREMCADVLVRGIRSDSELPYEEEMRQYNLQNGGLDTVFLRVDGFEDVSSTLVREQIKKGDYHLIPSGALLTVQKIMADKAKK